MIKRGRQILRKEMGGKLSNDGKQKKTQSIHFDQTNIKCT